MSKKQEDKLQNAVFNKSHYKNIFHPLYNIRQLWADVRASAQRINRGYSDYDTMDIDCWFINTIPNMLESFLAINKTWGSFPASFQLEIFEEHKNEIGCTFDEYRANYEGRFEKLHERLDSEAREKWRGIIENMIFLFRESDEDYSTKRNPYEDAPCRDSKYWDAERELDDYREKCKNQAFELFSKYFWNLWE